MEEPPEPCLSSFVRPSGFLALALSPLERQLGLDLPINLLHSEGTSGGVFFLHLVLASKPNVCFDLELRILTTLGPGE